MIDSWTSKLYWVIRKCTYPYNYCCRNFIRYSTLILSRALATVAHNNVSYSTVVLHTGIMKVRVFWQLLPQNQLDIYFLTVRDLWLAIAKLKNCLQINPKHFHLARQSRFLVSYQPISKFWGGGDYYSLLIMLKWSSLELFMHVFPTENHKRNKVFQNHVRIIGCDTPWHRKDNERNYVFRRHRW